MQEFTHHASTSREKLTKVFTAGRACVLPLQSRQADVLLLSCDRTWTFASCQASCAPPPPTELNSLTRHHLNPTTRHHRLLFCNKQFFGRFEMGNSLGRKVFGYLRRWSVTVSGRASLTSAKFTGIERVGLSQLWVVQRKLISGRPFTPIF